MSLNKQYYVYIMTNVIGTLYTGVTNDLERLVYQHKMKQLPGFTKLYYIDKLECFESSDIAEAVITREKQIKGPLKTKNVALINAANPEWKDLSEN